MEKELPLSGIRILELTHAVMGPSCGLILADLGAEVIHVESVKGNPTRDLRGFGTGYFPFYNRNKKSLALDIKSEEGQDVLWELIDCSDVLIENFGPGTMERLGFGPEAVKERNPTMIYCVLKGFLPGPYEKRLAMDEVVQMMGGLAYMTGPRGKPLRAGASVIDVSGGMFGAMAILVALWQRQKSGEGQTVKSSLFETTAFFMGQHMAWSTLSDGAIPPMPDRVSAWAVYQIFQTEDNESVFIGIISDKHWARFCETFDRLDLLDNETIQTNNDRIAARAWLLPDLERTIGSLSKEKVLKNCEAAQIPFALVATPEDLFQDPQLEPRLLDTDYPNGGSGRLPALPLEFEGEQPGLRMNPPKIGEHNRDVLMDVLKYSTSQVDALLERGVLGEGL